MNFKKFKDKAFRIGFYFAYKEVNISDPCGSFRTHLTIVLGKRNYKILRLHHDMV